MPRAIMNHEDSKETTISAEAMVAWNRIPIEAKMAIVEAVSHDTRPDQPAEAKQVKIGDQLLAVQDVSSGFRVVYSRGAMANTILSVLTPREAKLFGIK